MSKKIFFQLMTYVAIVCMCVCNTSCGSDDDDDYENTENISNQDPEGTVVLNMTSGAKNNYHYIGYIGEIHIDEANNFKGYWDGIEFVSVGKVSGLAKITQIPKSGWARTAAVVPGTGYVMRNNSQYARIYVVDYLGQTHTDEQGNVYGSTTGAIIKYQAPFELPIEL